jgi:hypothetical protein
MSQALLGQAEFMRVILFDCLHLTMQSCEEMMFGGLFECSLHEIEVKKSITMLLVLFNYIVIALILFIRSLINFEIL